MHIEADKLDARGMVQDFSDIKEAVKNWINDTLDHRMLLHKDDPLVPVLKQRGELFYVMGQNPTAENIAKLISTTHGRRGCRSVEVQLWETPTSSASYRG